jgi:cytochrome c oxidase subunit 2
VVVVAQAWAFIPAEIRVPAGAEVTITSTSVDIIHGLAVAGTRVNMMLLPGQISRNTYRFDRPGEYLLLCHEYCGTGHHTMSGKLIVEQRRVAATEVRP